MLGLLRKNRGVITQWGGVNSEYSPGHCWRDIFSVAFVCSFEDNSTATWLQQAGFETTRNFRPIVRFCLGNSIVELGV